MGASAVAAAIILKEKEIVAAFRQAGATAAATAKATAELGVHERLAFHKLRSRAVLREASPGRYYLDELSWEALRAMRRRVALLALLLIVLAFAVTLVRSR